MLDEERQRLGEVIESARRDCEDAEEAARLCVVQLADHMDALARARRRLDAAWYEAKELEKSGIPGTERREQ